jgi:hypothetical protein
LEEIGLMEPFWHTSIPLGEYDSAWVYIMFVPFSILVFFISKSENLPINGFDSLFLPKLILAHPEFELIDLSR